MSNVHQGKLFDPEKYAQNYNTDYGFEEHLTRARQNACLRFLMDKRPSSVLEVGCGPNLLFDRLGEIDNAVTRWGPGEPSVTYGQPAAEKFKSDARYSLVQGYLEERIDLLQSRADEGYDAVLLSGLLHETTEPERLLAAAHQLLADGGWAIVIVPNALSMHRLLAVEMNLTKFAGEITQRNLELGQPIVYSPDSMKELVEKCRFTPVELSGYMMKFLTNGQMKAASEIITPDLISGLEELGKKFPNNAAEFAWVIQKAG